MDGGFRKDVGVQSVAEVNGVDVVAFQIRVPTSMFVNCFTPLSSPRKARGGTYMMVKKTCRNRLAAFNSTARRYSHDSPDIVYYLQGPLREVVDQSHEGG